MSAADERRETRAKRQARLREAFAEAGGPTRVKLCGLSREADVAAANDARPDLVGFICEFPRSRRNVSGGRMGELAARVSPDIATVAVCVDLPVERVAALAEAGADVVQLHGHEDAAYLAQLRRLTAAPVIQAFVVRSADDVRRARESAADIVLLDAGRGSGTSFDWELVAGVGRPYLLAGGLTPDNVGTAVRQLAPWGVDMSSGVETEGHKDPDKMRAAVAAVRRESHAQ